MIIVKKNKFERNKKGGDVGIMMCSFMLLGARRERGIMPQK
jgi:hypothetical protein